MCIHPPPYISFLPSGCWGRGVGEETTISVLFLYVHSCLSDPKTQPHRVISNHSPPHISSPRNLQTSPQMGRQGPTWWLFLLASISVVIRFKENKPSAATAAVPTALCRQGLHLQRRVLSALGSTARASLMGMGNRWQGLVGAGLECAPMPAACLHAPESC